MSDRKRWFKVWTDFLMDTSMMELSMEERGRWMTLGALVAFNGISGTMNMRRDRLSELLRTSQDHLIEVLRPLPNLIVIDESNGTLTVQFKNWHKFQVDWSSDRVLKHRIREQEEDKKEKKEKTKPEEQERKRRKKFVKPTVEDIELYCIERKNNIDAQYFYNYYESRGWVLGGVKPVAMSDWQATIRTWENNARKKEGDKPWLQD